MENKFTEKGIVRKIIIALVFLVVFNFVYPYIPSVVYAAEDTAQEESLSLGPLFEPLMSLISGLGEGVIWLIQDQILGLGASNYYIDVANQNGWKDFWSAVGAIGGAVVLGGAAVAITVFTAGSGTAGAALLLSAAKSAVVPAAVGAVGGAVAGGSAVDATLPDTFYLPNYQISPQEIFSDLVPALHINFINPTDFDIETQSDKTVYNSAKELGPQIAKWYVAIRNMVLVGLMVVLLYIGIRIVISSTAGEKAKYKEHIKDWLIAVILVVFMHYIMAFAMTMTEYITSMLNSQNSVIAYPLTEEQMKKFAEESEEDIDISQYKNDDGKYYYATNLMGYARLQQQVGTQDENGQNQCTWSYIGYTIIYLALVIYTVMFLIIYLKRVIYMAFLTMIAPLVALTYPIDKISDGKAQAFDMWLKEYVYNLLLQPFHLLLYTLLIGSVMDLATNNMIYALVALGFLIPAEKLLRKFFGFEKAATTGSIVGGVVGGSLAMNAINKIGKIGSGKGSSSKGSASSSEGESNNIKLQERKADKGTESTDELLERGLNETRLERDLAEARLERGLAETRRDIPPVAEGQTSMFIDDNNKLVPNYDGDNVNNAVAEGQTSLFIDDNNNNLVPNYDVDNANNAGAMPKIRLANMETDNNRRDMLTQNGDKPKGKITRALKAAGGTGMKYTGKAISEVGKRAPRMLVQGAVGATMATAGVAAGLASGDLENAFTYGAAAAGVGAHLGSAATSVTGNIGQQVQSAGRDIRQDFRERYYDKDELERKQNDEADKKWRKDDDVIKLYKEKFGDKGYKQAMDDAMAYRRQGITDDKVIIGAQKLEGPGNADSTSRIATAQAATMVKTGKEDMKSLKERLGELGYSSEEVKKMAKNIRKINKM